MGKWGPKVIIILAIEGERHELASQADEADTSQDAFSNTAAAHSHSDLSSQKLQAG